MKKLKLIVFIGLFSLKGYSQSTTILPNQGVTVPQFTTAFINSMTSQPKGTVVFDSDINLMKYWNGSAWVNLTSGSSGGSGWFGNGNHLENTNTGNVGIGVVNPTAKLAIEGTDSNGSLSIKGSQVTSHFNYPQGFFQENTYIRGGTPSSDVIISDIGNNVGIGVLSPEYKLDVSNEAQFRNGIRAKGDIIRFFDNGFSGPAFYDGGLTLINNNLNTNARMKLDGAVIQTYQRNFGPNTIEAPSNMAINPFGGNVGIGTNFNPEYKLHLWSTGEQLVKVDGTNPLILFHDRTSNAQYGFLRTWTSNPFNPSQLYGQELGVPPSYGNDPAKHLMFSTNFALRMVIRNNGNVGIGIDDPGNYKLAVNGSIRAREIRVNAGVWADYVFAKNYKLRPLVEVEKYIQKYKHLPGIKPAYVIEKEGVDVSKIQVKMMEKIEELTLYIIEQNKRIIALEKKVKK